jgi:hypothetical protein
MAILFKLRKNGGVLCGDTARGFPPVTAGTLVATTMRPTKQKDKPLAILAVTVRRGMIEDVVSNHPELLYGIKVVTIDYDTETSEPSDLDEIKDDKGNTEPAYVSVVPINHTTINLDDAYKAVVD